MELRFRRAVAGLGGLAAVAGVAAYAVSGSAPASAAGSFTTIAIATPAKTNDYGWNAQGYAAAQAAAKADGLKVKLVANIGYNNTTAVLRQLAQTSGVGFIIAHASGYDTQAQQIARQYRIPIMTYDVASEKSPGTLSNITTQSQQGSYLAGIAAAKTSKTGHIGVIISASDTNWFQMEGGYIAGARSVDPKIQISTAEIGPASYDDSAGGKRVATSMIATGADVIFGLGDDSSFGYLQAISTAKAGHKVWYIGDIGDMTPIDKQKVLLSSVEMNFTPAFKQAIKDIKAGNYGKRGYVLTLANTGIQVLHTKYLSMSLWAQMMKAQKGIINGSIKVPFTTKASQVTALLNKK